MAAALAIGTTACGGATGSTADASSTDALGLGDGGVSSPGDGGSDAATHESSADADAGPTGLPAADPDAGFCSVSLFGNAPDVVCFGADPTPYTRYLSPDAGAVGRCPTPREFLPPMGEGYVPCGYWACGPLMPSAAEAYVDDAGIQLGDGGVDWSCCFLAVQLCGP